MDNAKLYLEDLLGVAAAGSVQPQGGIWRSYFAAGDGQQEATAWNSGLERFSCEHAAALNAACAHVMDMDDVHNASITHLGAVTIPAALAVGRSRAMARQSHARVGLIVLCVLICMATVFLKQHSLVDVVCGAALCLVLDVAVRKSPLGMRLLGWICQVGKKREKQPQEF